MASLCTYDSHSNYTGYEDNSHEIHRLRASIIKAYEASRDYDGLIGFLSKRAENISQKTKQYKDATIKYVLADSYYDLSVTYSKIGETSYAIQYGDIAFQVYQNLSKRFPDNEIYWKAIANMGRLLGNLFTKADSLTKSIDYLEISRLNYEKLARKDMATYRIWLVNVEQDLATMYSTISRPDMEISCRERLNQHLKILNETNAEAYMQPYYINMYSLLHLQKKDEECLIISKELLSTYDKLSSKLSYLSNLAPHTIREHIRTHSVKNNQIIDLKHFINRTEHLLQKESQQFVEEADLYMLGDAYYDLCELYRTIEKNDSAIFYGEKALQYYQKMQLNDVPAAYMHFILTVLYGEQNEISLYDDYLDKSLSLYTKLYKKNPSLAVIILIRLQNRKVWRLLVNGKVDDAMKLAETTFAMDESNEQSKIYLAECHKFKACEYADASDFANAHAYIDKAISMSPDNADFYDSKGEILLMQGKNDEALAMWKKVLELNPDFLDDYPDGTNLSNGLKKLGMIE